MKMAEIKDCPQCGLVNPPGALQCDCGYDFREQRSTRPFGLEGSLSVGDWIACLVFPVIGLVLGLVRLGQGKPTGGKMAAISAVVTVFWIMVRLLLFTAAQ
jgi:hypothetical protein